MIDVSGDGPNNNGRIVTHARDDALDRLQDVGHVRAPALPDRMIVARACVGTQHVGRGGQRGHRLAGRRALQI